MLTLLVRAQVVLHSCVFCLHVICLLFYDRVSNLSNIHSSSYHIVEQFTELYFWRMTWCIPKLFMFQAMVFHGSLGTANGVGAVTTAKDVVEKCAAWMPCSLEDLGRARSNTPKTSGQGPPLRLLGMAH